ncbi:MAG: MFS transporter [Acidimicrobiia bacterium]
MRTARRSLALALFAVAFGTNVATPLFLIYETRLDLSRWAVTALFAIYPIGLAPALAYAGPASDALGRKRLMIGGLVLSGLASAVMLAGADAVWLLFVGRLVLGAATGVTLVAGSAWMQELDTSNPMWTARLLGLLIYGGFGLGPLVGGLLGQWGPARLTSPYVVHLALVVVGTLMVGRVPETVTRTKRRIVPNLGIPRGSRSMFRRVVAPTALGVFGLPSLAFGLFPVLLRPAMASVGVLVTGVVFLIAMAAIVPAQAWVGRIGPFRAAPFGLIFGSCGCGLGLLAFATDAWPILFPASILMGAASGISMTSGLRFVDLITEPENRGALTGAFYAVAYAGMLSPLAASTVARAVGYVPVLAVLTAIGIAGSSWLLLAARSAGPAGVVIVMTSFSLKRRRRSRSRPARHGAAR